MLNAIEVLILTYNEAPNIGRTLEALRDFPSVLVLDSGSTDDTAAIVAGFPNARLQVRPFDCHANQWNFGLAALEGTRPWVLALDADHILTPELVAEISRLSPGETVSGYRARFRYSILGHRLSAALYPPLISLFRRERARYVQVGHTQRVTVEGEIADLAHPMDHDDRKPLARWVSSQQRYATLEAEYLLSVPQGSLRRTDRIRLMGWPAPILVFFYTLLVKRCLFDGWPGWFYVLQRTLAEVLIALELTERRVRAKG